MHRLGLNIGGMRFCRAQEAGLTEGTSAAYQTEREREEEERREEEEERGRGRGEGERDGWPGCFTVKPWLSDRVLRS